MLTFAFLTDLCVS